MSSAVGEPWPVGPAISGIVWIWPRAQKYVPNAPAATTITNADAVAARTRNTRRRCGWGCDGGTAGLRSGTPGSSVCVVVSWAIGCFEEPMSGSGHQPTDNPGIGNEAAGDDRVETHPGGGGTRERHTLHARARHRHRGGADPALDRRRRVVLGRGG